MNVLILKSSAQGGSSVSSGLADGLAARIRRTDPGAAIVERDVGAEPVPHLVEQTVGGIRAKAETEAERNAQALSDALIGELQAADLIVIASPMYNFGISSTLKAWFDHVLRAGITFRYTETGPEGLLKGRKAVVIESRAGLYSEGPAVKMDGQEPHLRTLLGFIGIEDVTFVRAEGLAFGPEAADKALAAAEAELDKLVGDELPLAA